MITVIYLTKLLLNLQSSSSTLYNDVRICILVVRKNLNSLLETINTVVLSRNNLGCVKRTFYLNDVLLFSK